MQIRLSNVSIESLTTVLEALGFGLNVVNCPVREQVETVSIWTRRTAEGPSGAEVGIIHREVSSFLSYGVILETERVESDRIGEIMKALAEQN